MSKATCLLKAFEVLLAERLGRRDFVDLEQDAAFIDAGRSRPVALLGQGEGLRHRRGQHVDGDALALQRVAGQHLDIEVLGDILERLAAVQAVDQVLRIFRRLGSRLFGPPILGDLVLDLIEGLELLGHDPQHLVPDHAVVLRVDRIVLDPGIGGEDRVQKLLLRGQRHHRAVRLAALAVDLVHCLVAELELVGDLGERRPRRQLVLDLVMQVEDHARCALLEERLFEIGFGFLEGRRLAGLGSP